MLSSFTAHLQWVRLEKNVQIGKDQAKKLVKSNNKNTWNCIFGSFKLFLQFKNWFLANFEIVKNGIWPKKWNWFIWFHEFLPGFSDPMWWQKCMMCLILSDTKIRTTFNYNENIILYIHFMHKIIHRKELFIIPSILSYIHSTQLSIHELYRIVFSVPK